MVNVDLTVEEFRTRLRQGKIYSADKVEQSLANFFRKGNLSMLRELALRTTAEQVSHRASEYRRSQGWNKLLFRKKSWSASAESGDRTAVEGRIAHRRPPGHQLVCGVRDARDKGHSDPEAYNRMEEYMRMARELGAQGGRA